MSYDLTFGLDYWECGDGCCSGHNYTVLLNGKEVAAIGEDEEYKKEIVKDFVSVINKELEQSNNPLHISDSFVLEDRDGYKDIVKAFFLNNTLIKDGEYGGRTLFDILMGIQQPLIYDTYYIDRGDFFQKGLWNILLQKRQEYDGRGEPTIRYKSNY